MFQVGFAKVYLRGFDILNALCGASFPEFLHRVKR